MGRMKRFGIIVSTLLLMGVQSNQQDAAFHQQPALEDTESSDRSTTVVVFDERPLADDETALEEGVSPEAATANVFAANLTEHSFEQVPDFRSMTVVSDKKRAFLEFLAPKVHASNESIQADRIQLLSVVARLYIGLTDADLEQVNALARRYKVPMTAKTTVRQAIHELLLRVDQIPVSLVLAQGATESGWGTSRFARDANNYFGIWCFTAGCGLTPLARDEGRSHQVAHFETVDAGVRYYMNNINTHRAYAKFRQLRAALDPSDQAGLVLADGLAHYSERGEEYVQDIKGMIRYNQLARFNP